MEAVESIRPTQLPAGPWAAPSRATAPSGPQDGLGPDRTVEPGLLKPGALSHARSHLSQLEGYLSGAAALPEGFFQSELPCDEATLPATLSAIRKLELDGQREEAQTGFQLLRDWRTQGKLTRCGDLAKLWAEHLGPVEKELAQHPDPLATPDGKLVLGLAHTLDLPCPPFARPALEKKASDPESESLLQDYRVSECRRLAHQIEQPGQDAYALSEQAERLALGDNLQARLLPMLAWARGDKSRDHEGIRLLARALVDPLLRTKAAFELGNHPELGDAAACLQFKFSLDLLQDDEEFLSGREMADLCRRSTVKPGMQAALHDLVDLGDDPGGRLRQAVTARLGPDYQESLQRLDPVALCEALGETVPGREHATLVATLLEKLGADNVTRALPAALQALPRGPEAALDAATAALLPPAPAAAAGVKVGSDGVNVGGVMLRLRTRS